MGVSMKKFSEKNLTPILDKYTGGVNKAFDKLPERIENCSKKQLVDCFSNIKKIVERTISGIEKLSGERIEKK